MATHYLKLAAEPFETIKSGRKTIESRLYDEKRQAIRIDDIVEFVNRDDPARTLRAKVTGLLRFATFADMFAANDPAKFGGENGAWLLDQINEFYSLADQERFGVVGIQFILV